MVVEWVILALTNESLGQINEKKTVTNLWSYYRISIGRYGNWQQQVTSYPVEFFNSLEFSGVPSNKLMLKVGVPVLLIRNLDEPRLRNGTRLQITYLGQNFVLATVITGIARGESVLIPPIQIIQKDLSSHYKR
ncbi:hypothetical protein AVEN_238659-1 [Araneus ventricosus]|uniref:DNA helicase Pif1-like 2B domain-containing protein n=1 Tax=Araneus ventricosus TaxID=182803 RepID=A0A4Y2Q883_ARAVE|nr:hypothetical protein AVEN_238659-1 [Araneus ventricosus]